jgi:alkylated DNA nucleotide flippase Atl1
MTNSIGVVSKLFGKLAKGSSVLDLQQCRLKSGYGIEGDIHANPQSPRQVLIMRQEDLQQGSLGFGPIAAIDPGKFSENILIRGIPASQFVPGAELRFADGGAIRLTFYCEPCKRIAGLVWSLSDIAQKRGILGVVVNDGVLAVGAEFMIQSGVFEALSEIPYQRFLDFLAKIPVGKVATYQSVLVGIGVDRGYLRAIPGYLQKAVLAGYPAHRVLDSKGYLTAHVAGQRALLIAEGIEVIDNSDKPAVSIEQYLWNGNYWVTAQA